MAAQPVRVEGLRELERALRASDADSAKELRKGVRDAAKIVSVDARSRAGRFGAFTAMGIRPRTRPGLVATVEQARRRTTGKRPDFGGLQMRHALVPALEAKEDEVIRHIENLIDTVGREHGF